MISKVQIPEPDYYQKLSEMVKIYNNIDSILEKINNDKSINFISKPLTELIEIETVFTYSGLLKRTQEA